MDLTWHDAVKDPPKENGRYIVFCHNYGIGRVEIRWYSKNLYALCPKDFALLKDKEDKSGWYYYSDEVYNQYTDSLYWMELPPAPIQVHYVDPSVEGGTYEDE